MTATSTETAWIAWFDYDDQLRCVQFDYRRTAHQIRTANGFPAGKALDYRTILKEGDVDCPTPAAALDKLAKQLIRHESYLARRLDEAKEQISVVAAARRDLGE